MEKQQQQQPEYVVSMCFLGINCTYANKNNLNKKIVELFKQGKAIPICPEQLGGFSTPRQPSEIISKKGSPLKVISYEGKDVTENFQKGAEEALKIAQLLGIKKAILKQESPSCGFGKIHDGRFIGVLAEGNGVTTDLFLRNNIQVCNENNLDF